MNIMHNKIESLLRDYRTVQGHLLPLLSVVPVSHSLLNNLFSPHRPNLYLDTL